ncbi:selenide,water dikinase [Roseinatronobacter thiooxidans]|uniref:Selenide,water dikinase n=1 Tax=Roseinatronobacter thiooxidans TaxID=121821 RepID=A0A2W7QM16_9RHOB|nr:selenide, water dikinase SelD [Roseinatronobacter thiooxidans]PZX42329.1 selenide,water dikinase [Roseinatronobacter thiooxidans]
MHMPLPLTRDLVLIGGGHTHALLLHRWAMHALPGVRLTLINPDPVAPYTGMLPGYIAGHYTREDLDIDLVRLARRAGARLILGKATGLDRAARLVHVAGRPPVAYDLAAIDIGITSDLPMIPGYADHAVSAKPLGGYAQRWENWCAQLARGEVAPSIAVIGGGVAGVELALAMAYRLRGQAARITIVQSGALLPNIGAQARARLIGHLKRAAVTIVEQAQVTEVTQQGIALADGTQLPASLVLGAAGSRPQGWLRNTGLDLTQGFITVDPYLRSITDPAIFAVGDCAHMAHAPRAKAGVYAVRQAPYLFDNLRAALGVGNLRAYQPQRDYLKLVSLGGKTALADKWSLPLEGGWLWGLKDRIDAKFMGQFRNPQPMPPALPPAYANGLAEALGDKPLCGGCGAKMGAQTLRAALPDVTRADIEAGIGDDAAILRIGDARQVIATDHLRALSDDPWLMARIAATHALGDIWAMGARPQAALAQVTLPRMSPDLQARTLREVMAGAQSVLEPAGVALVGGHSAMGAEMQLGFTVTGLLDGPARTKAGAQPGDMLVLTKPLGTGVIMAAEMQWAAPGAVVAGALRAMVQAQGHAAELLAPMAHAMTDVTGFGLAGHLAEMLAQDGLSARLDLAALPLLDGAEALVVAGHYSSIAADNRAALGAMLEAPDTARAALLVDPQTAGGLLAAVAPAQAAGILDSLQAAGYGAAIIGEITGRDGPRIVAR